MSWVGALKSGEEVMLGVVGERWVEVGTVRKCWLVVVVVRLGGAMAIFFFLVF